MEAFFSHHIYRPPQQFLKLLRETHREPRTCPLAYLHEQIDIAPGRLLSSNRRTKYADIHCSMLVGDPQDFLASSGEQFNQGHIGAPEPA
ncbi:MAG: hypothetical protein Kow00109_19530 [Acidobacteriota bacterium]